MIRSLGRWCVALAGGLVLGGLLAGAVLHAADGYRSEPLTRYDDRTIRRFATLTAAKAATDLRDGQLLTTAGYAAAGDAGGDLLRWQDTMSDWAATTAYALGDLVLNDTDKLYVCIQAGTSAGSGGPTGSTAGTTITDGTVEWKYADDGGFYHIVSGDTDGRLIAVDRTKSRVERFGADPATGGNDTTAVQAAIDAAWRICPLQFGPGIFECDQLTYRGGNWIGAGSGGSDYSGDKPGITQIEAHSDISAGEWLVTGDGTTVEDFAVIQGIYFEGINDCHGWTMTNSVNRLRFDDCVFRLFDTATDIDGWVNTFVNCYWLANNTGWIVSSANGTTFIGGETQGNDQVGGIMQGGASFTLYSHAIENDEQIDYSTGTVSTASDVVTLSGGTFPADIRAGSLITANGETEVVESRDSDTQLTLVAAPDVAWSADTFVLVGYTYGLIVTDNVTSVNLYGVYFEQQEVHVSVGEYQSDGATFADGSNYVQYFVLNDCHVADAANDGRTYMHFDYVQNLSLSGLENNDGCVIRTTDNTILHEGIDGLQRIIAQSGTAGGFDEVLNTGESTRIRTIANFCPNPNAWPSETWGWSSVNEGFNVDVTQETTTMRDGRSAYRITQPVNASTTLSRAKFYLPNDAWLSANANGKRFWVGAWVYVPPAQQEDYGFGGIEARVQAMFDDDGVETRGSVSHSMAYGTGWQYVAAYLDIPSAGTNDNFGVWISATDSGSDTYDGYYCIVSDIRCWFGDPPNAEDVMYGRFVQHPEFVSTDEIDHESVTAAADPGAQISEYAQWVQVTSASANNVVVLPAPIAGKIVRGYVGANGCEFYASGSSVDINDVVCSATNEAAMPANSLWTAECRGASDWVLTYVTSAGAAGSTITPDAR